MIQFSRREDGVEAKVVMRGKEEEEEGETSHDWTREMIRDRLRTLSSNIQTKSLYQREKCKTRSL